MSRFSTAFKFNVIGYDDKIDDAYKNKVNLFIFAINEDEAFLKASKLSGRNTFETVSITEVIDVYEVDKKEVLIPNAGT